MISKWELLTALTTEQAALVACGLDKYESFSKVLFEIKLQQRRENIDHKLIASYDKAVDISNAIIQDYKDLKLYDTDKRTGQKRYTKASLYQWLVDREVDEVGVESLKPKEKLKNTNSPSPESETLEECEFRSSFYLVEAKEEFEKATNPTESLKEKIAQLEEIDSLISEIHKRNLDPQVKRKLALRIDIKLKAYEEFHRGVVMLPVSPLTDTLHRSKGDDEESYTKHLANLDMQLRASARQKKGATYTDESKRTEELEKISDRLVFIKGFFAGEHDGWPSEASNSAPSHLTPGSSLSGQAFDIIDSAFEVAGKLQKKKHDSSEHTNSNSNSRLTDIGKCLRHRFNDFLDEHGRQPNDATELWNYMKTHPCELHGVSYDKTDNKLHHDGLPTNKAAFTKQFNRFKKPI